MLESLVVTLREGIEAALAVGIVLVYLKRSEREDLVHWVRFGLLAAVVASLAGAFAVAKLDLNSERTEGPLMLLAALLVITMIVWMGRHARTLKRRIESRVGEITAKEAGGAAAAGIFAFTFLMVFREGMETVLLLAAVNLTSDAMLAFLGGLAGVGIAVLFGVAFVKGSVRVDLARFFKVTSIVLAIFAAQLIIGGVHEFAEAGILRLGRPEMRVVGPIVKGQALFLAAVLALPVLLLLVPKRAARSAPSIPPAELSAPEKRRQLARSRGERRWRVLASAAGFVVAAALSASYAFTRLPGSIDPPQLIQAASEEIALPVGGLDDGHLHRLGVQVDGTLVRFLVMKVVGGKLVTAFDACQVCGASGYVEAKGRLVCVTCAADIVPGTVGVAGGCNPIPLASHNEAGTLHVALSDLRVQVAAFREAAQTASIPPPTR